MDDTKPRYLITGAGGFVAGHFLSALEARGQLCVILGVDVGFAGGASGPAVERQIMDLTDSEAVEQLVCRFRPTKVLHLASVSSVGVSWKSPVESFNNNTNIFLNLVDALRRNDIRARVLSVGSSEEYGQVEKVELPLIETMGLVPSSPYGVARVAQEQLSKVYSKGFGMDIVMTRSFNHIGPGQRDQFVVPSFVKQVVSARRRGLKVCTIHAGNTNVVRDFLDVRDVVEAYLTLLDRGRSGEVYNVCSGIGRSLDHILASLAQIVGISINVEHDPSLFRPNELMEIVGSAEKINTELGWMARIPFRQSLEDLVDYWESQLSS